MATVTGTIYRAGLTNAQFIPVQNQVFTVAFGLSANGAPVPLIIDLALVRSMDGGASFAPATPMISSYGNANLFSAPGSIDITEQRANVVYKFYAMTSPVVPINFGFYQ